MLLAINTVDGHGLSNEGCYKKAIVFAIHFIEPAVCTLLTRWITSVLIVGILCTLLKRELITVRILDKYNFILPLKVVTLK